LLKASLHEDFSSEEEYNSCCSTANPFTAQKAQFRSVKAMTLAYNTEIPCQGKNKTGLTQAASTPLVSRTLTTTAGELAVDDADWLPNAETFAQTGTKPFCNLPVCYANGKYWMGATKTANFTVPLVGHAKNLCLAASMPDRSTFAKGLAAASFFHEFAELATAVEPRFIDAVRRSRMILDPDSAWPLPWVRLQRLHTRPPVMRS
jgi:hypothetical protein